MNKYCAHLRVVYGKYNPKRNQTPGICRDCRAAIVRNQEWKDDRTEQQRLADKESLKEYYQMEG